MPRWRSPCSSIPAVAVPGRPAIAAGAAPPGRPDGHQQPDRRGRRARRRPVAHPPDALRERVRHRGPGRHVEPGPRAEGPARPDPAGRGRLRARPGPTCSSTTPATRPPRACGSGIKAGQPVAGPKVPVTESVGEGKDTEASEWIIRVVDRPDPRPVWVVIWGGSADLAQALWKVRRRPQPGRTRSLRRQAAGPRHRRPGLDRAVDQGGVPRPVHDHPAAGLPGDVPGRRHRAVLVRLGPRSTSTATGRWATSTRTTTAATSGRARWAGSGGSRRATRRRSSRWSPTAWATWSVPGWGAGAGGSRAKAIA